MRQSRMLNKIIEFVVLTLVVIICSALARATTVTGTTVSSGDGQLLTNARVTAEFVPKQGTFGSPTISSVSATTDTNGSFTMTLTDVNTINPRGGTWKFIVCPNATVPCTIIPGVVITGTTQEIGGLITSNIPTLSVAAQTLVPKAYNDSQVPVVDLSNIGAMYWNTVTKNIRLWDGTVWNDLVNYKNINGVRFANQYVGADASVKINACIADVITAGGGICDARFFTGTQTMSQIIAVGNTSLVPVTLLLPNTGSWLWSTDIGSNCAVTLHAMSAILGSGNSGEGQRFSFQGVAGFSGISVFCTAHPAGGSSPTTDSYYRAENFNVRLATGTVTTAATQLKYGADSTVFRSINTNVTQGSTFPTAVLVDNMCCGASLYNVGADSGGDGLGGTANSHSITFGSNIVELSVFGGSAVHAGPGASNIFMNFNNAASNPHIQFYGTYIEQSQLADNFTPQVKAVSAATGNKVSFYGVSCLMQSTAVITGNASYCIDGDVNTNIDVRGGLIRGEGSTQYFVNDHRANYHITTGAGGQVSDYSTLYAFIGTAEGLPSNGFIVKSNMGDLDNDAIMGVDSGKTVAKISEYCFYDRAVSQWCWQKDISNILRLLDWQNSAKNRITVQPNGITNIHSGGTSAVGFNTIAGSGTGGVQGSDGSGGPLTWTVSGAGLGTFNAGVKVGTDTTMTNAPRMLWTCQASTLTSVQSWCRMIIDKAITITRVYVSMNATAVAGCTTAAIVRVGDGTNNVDTSLANGSQTDDSGAVAVNVPAGATLSISEPTAPAGCTTNPANGYITAQYRMQ